MMEEVFGGTILPMRKKISPLLLSAYGGIAKGK
jgi:hypothetical protein